MPIPGNLLLRGDAVLSDNLAGLDTVAIQMEGIAFLNPRCKDALCHYELAWPPGERPTRPQWMDCASHTLNALGYRDHQYMVVAHDDKKHFHIHIMVNKVHPETFKAHTPYRNWLTLDAAMRVLEAKYGWTHTAGPTRWDEESKQAVRASRSERNALRTARQQPTGAAAKFEHYHDEESLQTYVRREVAPRVRTLLTRQNVRWEALHTFLAKYHLRIEKGESGGYTVLAVDHNIRVKASDVFRNNFAGRVNRQATETALGPWTPASTSIQHSAPHLAQHSERNTAQREERKAQRRADRSALMDEYNQYRNRQREVCKAFTTDGRECTQYLREVSAATKEGDSCIRSVMAGQEGPALPGGGAIRSRSARSEADHSTAAERSISEEPPHLGSGQGQRGRCAGGRTASRMAICRSTQSAAARCKAGSERDAHWPTARS